MGISISLLYQCIKRFGVIVMGDVNRTFVKTFSGDNERVIYEINEYALTNQLDIVCLTTNYISVSYTQHFVVFRRVGR